MSKQLKPGRYYLITNIDEPYAADVYEVIKHGQMQKEAGGENAWPEGDIPFADFLSNCWPNVHENERVRLARMAGELTPDRDRYRLVKTLRDRIAILEAVAKAAEEYGEHLERAVTAWQSAQESYSDVSAALAAWREEGRP
jgi:hypothetical protein